MRNFVISGFAAFAITASAGAAEPIRIVAAENFYGDIARQIGGAAVAVSSILSSPEQDPHEFEASPSAARALADANLVIYNGADYDPWAARLLSASPSLPRKIIVVAALVHTKAGQNPHVWYRPGAAPALAGVLADALAKLDPAHQADYRQRLAVFVRSLAPLDDRVAELRRKFAGMPVTATEPIFGYMADALGLEMRNRRLQLAVMNDTEPSASDIAAFETDLRTGAVKALIYNIQTGGALTRRLREIAQRAGVPIVGVTETEPRGKDYQEWMMSQLDALDRALTR